MTTVVQHSSVARSVACGRRARRSVAMHAHNTSRHWASAAAAFCLSCSLHLCDSPAALAQTATAPVRPGTEFKGAARVVDGDTLVVSTSDGTVRARLMGIDAPESDQLCKDSKGKQYECGKEAAAALRGRIGSSEVRCKATDVDRYGRTVAQCFVGGSDLGDFMVKNGEAVAYTQYSKEYASQENEAKSKRVGIWQGTFEEPRLYRQDKRADTGSAKQPLALPAPASTPPLLALPAPGMGQATKCDIKGNISASGEKIYHTRASRYYDTTVIEEDKGEKYFCSEEEAVKAGWRPARP